MCWACSMLSTLCAHSTHNHTVSRISTCVCESENCALFIREKTRRRLRAEWCFQAASARADLPILATRTASLAAMNQMVRVPPNSLTHSLALVCVHCWLLVFTVPRPLCADSEISGSRRPKQPKQTQHHMKKKKPNTHAHTN